MRRVPAHHHEIVEHERRFPAVVETLLARRRAEALGSVAGRILDLDDPAAREVLAAALDAAADEPVEPAWDAVVSIAQLVRFPDLGAALRTVDRLLVDDGRLLVVEPVTPPGTLRMFLEQPFALLPAVRGFHLGRDLAAALRTTSLVADDIERLECRTAVPGLRHFLSIRARHAHAGQETK